MTLSFPNMGFSRDKTASMYLRRNEKENYYHFDDHCLPAWCNILLPIATTGTGRP